MKKRTRNILIMVLSVVLIIGSYLFVRRVRPLPEVDGELVWINVMDNRTDPSVELELTEGEADILSVKLKALKMKWSGGRVYPFSIENVDFFVDYIAGGEPFHLVLGDPCFAYESADQAKYLIVQDDAYRRLMEELRNLAEP